MHSVKQSGKHSVASVLGVQCQSVTLTVVLERLVCLFIETLLEFNYEKNRIVTMFGNFFLVGKFSCC